MASAKSLGASDGVDAFESGVEALKRACESGDDARARRAYVDAAKALKAVAEARAWRTSFVCCELAVRGAGDAVNEIIYLFILFSLFGFINKIQIRARRGARYRSLKHLGPSTKYSLASLTVT